MWYALYQDQYWYTVWYSALLQHYIYPYFASISTICRRRFQVGAGACIKRAMYSTKPGLTARMLHRYALNKSHNASISVNVPVIGQYIHRQLNWPRMMLKYGKTLKMRMFFLIFFSNVAWGWSIAIGERHGPKLKIITHQTSLVNTYMVPWCHHLPYTDQQ